MSTVQVRHFEVKSCQNSSSFGIDFSPTQRKWAFLLFIKASKNPTYALSIAFIFMYMCVFSVCVLLYVCVWGGGAQGTAIQG
jgi:hypothetical protein